MIEGQVLPKALQYPGFLENLKLIQMLQYLDIVFGVLGVTKTNALLSFLQISGRNFAVFCIFQHNLDARFASIAIVPWSLAELIRYPYYMFADTGVSSTLESVFKWLRLTAFIVLYPVGVTGECLTLWESLDILVKKRPYSLDLPNQYNFAFDIVYAYYSFFVVVPLGMLFIYSSLLKARRRAYGKPAPRESGKVKAA
jgi:very-long-chain (3R)-3-hydroxyacyl-CoA dehydratase